MNKRTAVVEVFCGQWNLSMPVQNGRAGMNQGIPGFLVYITGMIVTSFIV
jgi:hypothetical protein